MLLRLCYLRSTPRHSMNYGLDNPFFLYFQFILNYVPGRTREEFQRLLIPSRLNETKKDEKAEGSTLQSSILDQKSRETHALYQNSTDFWLLFGNKMRNKGFAEMFEIKIQSSDPNPQMANPSVCWMDVWLQVMEWVRNKNGLAWHVQQLGHSSAALVTRRFGLMAAAVAESEVHGKIQLTFGTATERSKQLASKRHLRLGKATYGHERFMITLLQHLQNISHDPISGAQVRDLSSVNYTLAVERKELLSTCIMIRLLQVFPWGVNYAYIIFLGGFSSIQKTMGTIRDSTRSCWVATWDWKY